MKFRFAILFLWVLFFFQQKVSGQFTYNELEVCYDSPWTYKNLQLVPILFKPRGGGPAVVESKEAAKPSLSFSEALLKRKIKVQEMPAKNGADINSLQVTNHSKQNLVIQSGEILGGGKQDRMVAETKFIGPGKTDYVNVFCVEKRRWDKKPKKFKHRGVADSKVRKVMEVKRRQSEVWKEIDQQYSSMKAKSETGSYVELHKNTTPDTGYIRFFTNKYLQSDSNIAGFIFITGKRIISTEVFATTDLLRIGFNNMLSGYVKTVYNNGEPPAVTKPEMITFTDKVYLNEEVQKKYIARYGKIYTAEGRKIHLVAYEE